MKKYLFQAVNFFLLFSFMVSNSPLYGAEGGGKPKAPSFISYKKQEISGEMKRLKIELQKLVEVGKNIDKGIKVPVGYFVLTLEGIMLIMSEIVQLLIHSINIPGQYYLYRLLRKPDPEVGILAYLGIDKTLGIPTEIKLDEAALQKKFDSYAQSKAFKRLMNMASKLIIGMNKYIINPGWITLSTILIIFIHLIGIFIGIQYSILKYGSRLFSYTLWELSVGLTELLGIKAKEQPGPSFYRPPHLPPKPSRTPGIIWEGFGVPPLS